MLSVCHARGSDINAWPLFLRTIESRKDRKLQFHQIIVEAKKFLCFFQKNSQNVH